MIKKRYLFLIIIVCLFAISAVSAEEINNKTNEHDSSIITESADSNLLTENTSTFADLQNLINNNDVINLTKDYTAAESEGRVYINGDKIINGYGHIICGNNKNGIFKIDSGKIIFNDMVIKNGRSESEDDKSGGAIDGLKAASLTLINVTFLNNHAKFSGGAIITSEPLNIINCTFVSNKANGEKGGWGGWGGAVYGHSTTINIKNCIFQDNYANREGGGGAIFTPNNDNSDIIIDNCTFLNNYANYRGGAINGHSVTWVDSPSYFIGNQGNGGGAIYTRKFNTDVKYGVFINNTVKSSSYDGGAIYIFSENHVTFSQCYFENNHCGDEGGAIYLDSYSSHLSLRDNVFIDNSAGSKGQIVYNCGYYDDEIKNNWYGTNNFDFTNQFKECHWYGDEDHADSNPALVPLILKWKNRM